VTAATLSIDVSDPVASVNGIPAAFAARASAISPSCHMRPAVPVGAMTMGIFCFCPKRVISWLRFEMSTSVRGLKRIFSNTARLLRSDTSSSVPRSTNSNSPFGTRRRAISRKSAML
jgi:hypothetical protein